MSGATMQGMQRSGKTSRQLVVSAIALCAALALVTQPIVRLLHEIAVPHAACGERGQRCHISGRRLSTAPAAGHSLRAAGGQATHSPGICVLCADAGPRIAVERRSPPRLDGLRHHNPATHRALAAAAGPPRLSLAPKNSPPTDLV